jgi:hypothetical protein
MEDIRKDLAVQRWVDRIGDLELDPYSASEQVVDLITKARERPKRAKRNMKKPIKHVAK